MNKGICPKCGVVVESLIYEQTAAVDEAGGHVLSLLTLTCSRCRVVLGVKADPSIMAAKYEAVEAGLAEVQKNLAQYLRHMESRVKLEKMASRQ